MAYGFLIGLAIHGSLVALTLLAPRQPRWLAGLAYRVASVYNEAPLLIMYLVVIATADQLLGGALDSPGGRFGLAVAALVVAGFLVIAWRGAVERPVVRAALDEGTGGEGLAAGMRRRPPLTRILLMPIVLRPRSVARVGNIAYGDAGERNLLDVYHRRDRPEGAPVLIYLHGGGFYRGRKSVEGRALLFRLASQGWVTISANYRLRPEAAFFDHLTDVKRVIAWVRDQGHHFGADASTLVVSGGSAGGHLASVAGLTQNQPRYQPGFEAADTSVTAVASLYGWYGGYWGLGGPHSEMGVLGHPAQVAPAFFIAHGAEDSLSPIESARRFVDHLRSGSSEPIVFAELPHGQHAFDLFHSFRFSAVVDGIEAFAAWVVNQPARRR